MTNTINGEAGFECQVRAIDEFGRSGSLWIPICVAASLEGAQSSGFEQLEKQRNDADRLQFQILNLKGDVVCTMDPPHREWVMNYVEDSESEQKWATKEEVARAEKMAKIAAILGVAALAGLSAMGISLQIILDRLG